MFCSFLNAYNEIDRCTELNYGKKRCMFGLCLHQEAYTRTKNGGY